MIGIFSHTCVTILIVLVNCFKFNCYLHVAYAEPTEFPYIASIYNHSYYFTEADDLSAQRQTLLFLCTGVLISDKYVISAAHCYPKKERELLNLVVILSPIYKGGPDPAYAVEKLIVHDKYDSDQSNDIALLGLSKSVGSWTSLYMIHPVKLPTEPSYKGASYEVGWLQREQLVSNCFVRKVKLKIISSAECVSLVNPNLKKKITQGRFCAVDIGRSACFGDAGVPLIYKGVKSEDDILIGINIYGGDTCGSHPQIYTSVYNYSDWIKQKIKIKIKT